jgi:hypothetical protein
MMLGILMNATNRDDSMTSKTLSSILTTIVVVILVCSFVLAVKMSKDMRTTGSRAALICLSILYPDLFILGYLINQTTAFDMMSLVGSP